MNYTTTLAEYIAAVKDELSIPQSTENLEWSDSLITRRINDARQVFWNRAGYRSREGMVTAATTANTPTVSIPQSIDTIRFIRVYNGSRRTLLDFIPYDVYLSYTDTAQNGQPFAWSRLGDTVYLLSAPTFTQAAGVEFFGLVGLTELVTGATDTDIERRWKDLIVNYAIGMLWLKAEQPSNATSYFAIFEKLFKDNNYEIVSGQIGQNIPSLDPLGWIPETDERRWGPLS